MMKNAGILKHVAKQVSCLHVTGLHPATCNSIQFDHLQGTGVDGAEFENLVAAFRTQVKACCMWSFPLAATHPLWASCCRARLQAGGSALTPAVWRTLR